MFTFALKMCVTDLKRMFHRFWWIAPIFLILMIIGPLCEAESYYAFTYIIIMMISILIPRFSRIHFVLPLDEKQMKKVFIYRLLIVCITMILIAVVFIGIRILTNQNWEVTGVFWVLGYVCGYLLSSEVGITSYSTKDYTMGVRRVIAIVVGIITWFVGLIVMDYVDLKWMLCLSLVLVIFTIFDVIWYVKKSKIEDYTYVPFGFWDNGKIERN